MKIWAIVPVKALQKSKSRLQDVLTPDQRIELSREMLVHTLTVLSDSPEINRTLVVSEDPEVLALAGEGGAQPVDETGSPDLNRALSQAAALAQEAFVEAVLVLPADLPLIQVSDVQALIERAGNPPVVVLSPDRVHSGTNALMMIPPGTIKYGFGPDSFDRHLRRAEASGARIEMVERPALGLDLDTPDDLEIYRDQFALMKE